MSNQVQAVKFYDDTLITLEKDGEHYVAVRPIVENMGLDWARQSTKLKNPKFNCCHMPTVAQDGKIREVLCMPIKKLNGWLFSINPEKVRSDIRHIVEQYQEECFTVLHDYWHKGVAVNERAVENTPKPITPQSLTELAPITPFKSHMSAMDSQAVIEEMRQVYTALVPLIRQVADCYYDKQMALSQIEATIEHYCGVKNSHWITLERLPTALTVLSIMKNEALAHKKMMHRLDDNARLALSYKTVNVIGYTGETFDDVGV